MSSFIKVKTGGTHREMGVDFGRAAKDILHELHAESVRFFRKYTTHDAAYARRYAMRHFFPHVHRRYPWYLEETRGIAEGAGLAVDDAFFLSADEELAARWAPKHSNKEKCSSAAVRTADGMFLLHNEDYPPRYFGRLVIVEAEPNDAPAFLALTYPYMLAGPSCGLNETGLAFSADSLNYPVRSSGVPSNFVLRDMYCATRLNDVRFIAGADALMGNAVTVVSDEEGSAVTIETRPDGRAAQITMPDYGLLAHTNHVLAPRLDRKGEKPTESSKRRLAALEYALVGSADTADLRMLERVLSSKELCRPERAKTDSCTIASVVLDPKQHILYVAKRGPAGHGYRPYKLK